MDSPDSEKLIDLDLLIRTFAISFFVAAGAALFLRALPDHTGGLLLGALFWVILALIEAVLLIVALVAGFKAKARVSLAAFLSAALIPVLILIFLELFKLVQRIAG